MSWPKAAIQSLVRRYGYRLVRVPAMSEYEKVVPCATYAPWKSDPAFLSTYQLIRQNTLVDMYRAWELWKLVEQTSKLKGSILEVGVWRGGTGALIAKRAALVGIQEPVYLCDTFEGVVKAGGHDTRYQGGEHADTSLELVEGLLRSLGLTNARILKGIFPDETAHLVETGTCFRLCHIDVDVYESAKDVMAWIWNRMVPGGIAVYDDYGFEG